MSLHVKQAAPAAPGMPAREMRRQRDASTSANRLVFVDYLRIGLISLVVIQHIAVTYGATGSWYYRDPGANVISGTVLTTWTGIGQACGLGLFFLLAGYFTPRSYDRKGGVAFARDRLLRLGIPLLAYDLLLQPLIVYIAQGARGSYWPFYATFVLSTRSLGSGPVWFIELLLLFALAYAGWRLLGGPVRLPAIEAGVVPRTRAIAAFIVVLAFATFVVRGWWPSGWFWPPLNLPVGYLPQYIAMFVVGVMAYRGNWFFSFPRKAGRNWMLTAGIAIGGMLLQAVVFVLIGAGATTTQSDYAAWVMRELSYYGGGLHWQSAYNALWEAVLVVSAGIGLIVLLREHATRPRPLTSWLAANTYGVYLIHPLVLVSVAIVLQPAPLNPLLKFALVTLIALPLCFALSDVLRRLPGVRRIL